MRNFYRFARNVWAFRGALWNYYPFDYSCLLRVMQVALRDLHKSHVRGYHVGSERHARQTLVAAELCKRILADDYLENAGYDWGTWRTLTDAQRTRIAHHSVYMAKQDAEYLGRMMRFVQHWWE